MSKLTDAITAVETKEAELLTLSNDSVQPVLDAMAATGLVPFIYIQGYTPGFNDGDPCVHSCAVATGIGGVCYYGLFEDNFIQEALNLSEGDLKQVLDALESRDEIPHVSRYSEEASKVAEYTEKCKVFEDEIVSITKIPWHMNNKEINQAISAIIEPALEREFGTNFQVAYRLVDGEYKRTDDEYNCGY